ncbi:MAG: hypothetical protein LBJ01_00480 [Tannerella sp.]|jgi:hypothetical protein|nr:hypothetical protein [Tannerella sp.]
MAKKSEQDEKTLKAKANELMTWYGIDRIWGDPDRSHWFTTENGAKRHEADRKVKLQVFEKEDKTAE